MTTSTTLSIPVPITVALKRILLGLMIPSAIMVLNGAMFSVALPTMRTEFRVEPDLAAWLVTSYTLPFVIFTPLYGRLGDSLGKRRMLLVGMIVYAIGVFFSLWAVDQRMIAIGRVAQGIGTAGINPLSIALISELAPPAQRGQALGTWSSTGPAIATLSPFMAGFLVDQFGWRANFVLLLAAAVLAFVLMWRHLPRAEPIFEPTLLLHFDWIGFLLLAISCTCFVFYLSSRPITGIEPLHDWRLLVTSLLFFLAFYGWERFFHAPLLDFSLFQRKNFGVASLCALLRMVLMNSCDFLLPLYFTDIFHLGPAWIGVVLALYSSALLTTTRFAGKGSDGGNGRWFILGGLFTQCAMLLTLALLPAATSIFLVIVVTFVLGMGAGLSLAVLSNVAMSDVPRQQAGAGAGLFSMIRFSGSMVGSTLAGVILRNVTSLSAAPIQSYQIVFGCAALVAALGAILALRLQSNRSISI